MTPTMTTVSTKTTTTSSTSKTASRHDDLRRIETEVGVLIRRVKRVIGERAREVHPELHPMTYLILSHLVGSGPLRGADLSGTFGMDKGGVSRQVQALVDLGLVERQPDPEDRRAALLAATAEGRNRFESVAQARSDRFADRLSGWSDDDLQAFARQISDYNAALADDAD